MIDLLPRLQRVLGKDASSWLTAALERVRGAARTLPEVFPEAPRRVGRAMLPAEMVREDGLVLELGAFQLCDAAAHALLAAAKADDATIVDLFLHGDVDERAMVLRAMQARELSAATLRLLAEVQRSNVQPLFEALCCDTNLLARAARHPDFGQDPFNRTLLKLAFLGLPLARAIGAETLANPELSRMVQDLASEREAAGRTVWVDTNRLAARAPTAGTLARLVGGLEHGDDGQRKAAAEGLLALGRKDLHPFVHERLSREPRAELRALLQKILET